MKPEILPLPRFDWQPLPLEGCVNVEVRVLSRLPHLALAMLRFAPYGTIHGHAAALHIDVVCLGGPGRTGWGGEAAPTRGGEGVRCPRGTLHRLWTAGSSMLTLMVEHHSPPA